MTKHPLEDILESKVSKWSRDRFVNPIGATIRIESVSSFNGETIPHVSFEVCMKYSILIRILLLPLYIASVIPAFAGLFDYLEDVAYFKSVTRRGINRKYAELAKIRSRVDALIDDEILRYEAETKSAHQTA